MSVMVLDAGNSISKVKIAGVNGEKYLFHTH